MTHPLIGAWRVETKGAPFPYHMFAFHSDGTMQQSNPPAGNTETSDSAGLGVWEDKTGKLRARFEEFRVSYADGAVTRGVIDLTLRVHGDALSGDASFVICDVHTDKPVAGPFKATVTGVRISLPK